MSMIEVAAAILKHNETVLICKRPKNKLHGDLWEFPGGKLEVNETANIALKREMQEELNLAIEVDGLYLVSEKDNVRITFLLCHQIGGTLTLNEHQAYAFVTPAEMQAYSFCPADQQAIKTLLQRPRFEAYIWDLDGTLMDTYAGMTQAMQYTLRTLGIDSDQQELYFLMKQSVRAAISHYHADTAQIRSIYNPYEASLALNAKPMKGMPELLSYIKTLGGHHFVYTHRGNLTYQLLANAFPDGTFTDIVTIEAGYPMKPSPDALIALVKKHGLHKEHTLMVGDRDIDVLCANNAGICGCLYDPDRIYEHFETTYRANSIDSLKTTFVSFGD